MHTYCTYDQQEITAWRARGAHARDSVNFRNFLNFRNARAGLTVYPPSRTFQLLAFDEYCRFDTSACKRGINRGSLYTAFASRNIKMAVFIES
jgi:hypothetical protein